jgi:prophage DNA circulation protein
MTWREKYQSGKFRDAEFVTTDSGFSGGRRLAVHEYPKRDLPFAEDMGRKARQFTLTLFVIGDDYMDKRDRLYRALEDEGSGTLIHPYFGTLTVAVDSFRVSESTREGGKAGFDVTFIESGENTFPTVASDTSATVKTKSDSAITVLKDVFNNNFNVTQQPEFISTEATSILSDISDQLMSKITRFPTLPSMTTDFIGDAGQLSNNASTLILKPASLATSITGLFNNVQSLYSNPLNSLNVYRRFFDYGDTLPNVPASTLIRSKQIKNEQALTNLVEQTALIESARSASDIEFDSYDDAVLVRDELDEKLDAQMLVANDDTYQALNEVRVAMINDISTRSADLARTVNYTPKTTLPALVIAHELYGDATTEEKIINRNNIRHPGFITGGNSLEVLTDVA